MNNIAFSLWRIALSVSVLLGFVLPGSTHDAGRILDRGMAKGQNAAVSDVASLASWYCYPDGSTDPCHNDLHAISMRSSTDGWAVGDNGTILRYTGQGWMKVDSPTQYGLYGVAAVNANMAWAVGFQGTLLAWDGSAWSIYPLETTSKLTTVRMLSAGEGWIGGEDGALYHWDGAAWTLTTLPREDVNTTSISIISDNLTLLLGYYYMGPYAYNVLYQWDGTVWSLSEIPLSGPEMYFTSLSEGWFFGVGGGSIDRWNGTSLTNARPGSGSYGDGSMFMALSGSAPNDVWAVGNGGNARVSHWDGTVWVDYSNFPFTQGLEDVAAVTSSDAWAVGLGGVIYHWNGIVWNRVSSVYLGGVNALKMVATNNVWGVGAAGRIVHYDGQAWTSVASPTALDLSAVDFLDDDTGWAAGSSGRILQWDGQAWTIAANPTTKALNSLKINTQNDAWAVGEEGTILHWDGGGWHAVDSPTTYSLSSVSFTSPSEGWAVGDFVILRWHAGSWSVWQEFGNTFFSSVTMVSETDGWITNTNGAVYHWDGTNWIYGSTGDRWVNRLASYAANDVWAVGGGSWLHWNGNLWEDFYAGSADAAIAIDMLSPNDAWASTGDTLWHWDGDSWLGIPDWTTLTLSKVSAGQPDMPFIGGGDARGGRFLHLYGKQWMRSLSPADAQEHTITAIWMVSPTLGWAVSSASRWEHNHIYQWDGNNWRAYSGASYYLNDLCGSDSRDIWAVGSTYLYHWDGTTWTQTNNPAGANFSSCTMISATDGWAANIDGSMYHWDGYNWTPLSNPINTQTHEMAMLGNSGWVVGSEGVVMRWDGQSWSEYPSPAELWPMMGIDLSTENDGWLVGAGGLMLHWNGVGWTNEPKVTSEYIFSVQMKNAAEGWAASSSAVLHMGAEPQSVGTISGRVTTPDGSKGIAGVTISDGAGHATTTDTSGSFSFGGLSYGSYALTARKDGYLFAPASQFVTLSSQYRWTQFKGVMKPKDIDLTISLYRKPAETERKAYESILHYFAEAIFEMSNGAQRIRNITIDQNGENSLIDNIVWVNDTWPSAAVSGYYFVTNHVSFGDLWTQHSGTVNQLDESNWKDAGYGLGHEWGHYYYGLYDEYQLDPNSESHDEDAGYPRKTDTQVPYSVMSNQHTALFGNGDMRWMNFSIPEYTWKIGNNRTAQYRVYGESGWETLARPTDPFHKDLTSEIRRRYYPELAQVAPSAGADPSHEVPYIDLKVIGLEPQITWVAPIFGMRSAAADSAYAVIVTSLNGTNLPYPAPAVIGVSVRKNGDAIAKASVTANVSGPEQSVTPLDLRDDGVAPDQTADDGLYSGVFSGSLNGDYTITASANNHAGQGVFTEMGMSHSVAPNGDTYNPTFDPVGEDFNVSGETTVTVTGVQADDHGNVPQSATLLATNNSPVTGRIDFASDKDVFKVLPTESGILAIRLGNLALNIQPQVRILAKDGSVLREFDARLDSSSYFFTLVNTQPSEPIYIEVSDQDGSMGGLYAVSVGQPFHNERSCSVYLPLIKR